MHVLEALTVALDVAGVHEEYLEKAVSQIMRCISSQSSCRDWLMSKVLQHVSGEESYYKILKVRNYVLDDILFRKFNTALFLTKLSFFVPILLILATSISYLTKVYINFTALIYINLISLV